MPFVAEIPPASHSFPKLSPAIPPTLFGLPNGRGGMVGWSKPKGPDMKKIFVIDGGPRRNMNTADRRMAEKPPA